MPRLPTSLLRKAYIIDSLLPPLLGPCRNLGAAQNELRWLREHVDNIARTRSAKGESLKKGALLRQLVQQRASGRPLQYILGSEYFGDLEIKCRPGVLIPRQDTAASISHLARLIRSATNLPSELRILDLCTGTGCIPLLFQHDFRAARSDVDLRILGADVSSSALDLAKHNLERIRNNKTYKNNKDIVEFIEADVLINPFAEQEKGRLSLKAALNLYHKPQFWDIVISNPPYISPASYWKTTTRSVRGFEPKLALVPPSEGGSTDAQQGDAFYPNLLCTARDAEAKVVLLEVADLPQALRVAQVAKRSDIFDGIEIWRDQPDQPCDSNFDPSTQEEQSDFPIIGAGNARSVLCWRGSGAKWLGKTSRPSSNAEDANRLFVSQEHLQPTFKHYSLPDAAAEDISRPFSDRARSAMQASRRPLRGSGKMALESHGSLEIH